MTINPQVCFVISTMRSLRDAGSWCGETHVQKALYLCQELLNAPTAFKYVMYKHGPYSFELSDCLQDLIADDLVQIIPRPPYGPSLSVAPQAVESSECKRNETSKNIDKLSALLSKKDVAELEKLATAVFLKRVNSSTSSQDQLAHTMSMLKPHISVEAAKKAFVEAEAIEKQLTQVG